MQPARYMRGPTRGSETLYAHAQYSTQPVGVLGTCCSMHGVMNSAEGFAL